MKQRTILAGGLLAILLVSFVGGVITTAQNSTATTQTPDTQAPVRNDSMPFPGNHTRGPMPFDYGFRGGHFPFIPPGVNLTAAQWDELNDTLATLREQNATFPQMQTAIFDLLDSFGVYDAQLNASIANAQRRLDILNREKELRSQGYNWTTIETMITEEFGQNAAHTAQMPAPGMMMGRDFGCRGPHGGGKPKQ